MAEVHAALGHHGGVAMLVHHALSNRVWVLERVERRACRGGSVYRWFSADPTTLTLNALHPECPISTALITVIMRLPPTQTSSELVLARTAGAAVTSAPESVRRWLTATRPAGPSTDPVEMASSDVVTPPARRC